MGLNQEEINFIKSIKPGQLYKITVDEWDFELNIKSFGEHWNYLNATRGDVLLAIRSLTQQEEEICYSKLMQKNLFNVPMYWFLCRNTFCIVEVYDQKVMELIM